MDSSVYTERNVCALFSRIEGPVEQLGRYVNGSTDINNVQCPSTLSKMVENAKLPPEHMTRLRDAWDAFEDALNDVEMCMRMPFEIAAQELKEAMERARALGVDMQKV